MKKFLMVLCLSLAACPDDSGAPCPDVAPFDPGDVTHVTARWRGEQVNPGNHTCGFGGEFALEVHVTGSYMRCDGAVWVAGTVRGDPAARVQWTEPGDGVAVYYDDPSPACAQAFEVVP